MPELTAQEWAAIAGVGALATALFTAWAAVGARNAARIAARALVAEASPLIVLIPRGLRLLEDGFGHQSFDNSILECLVMNIGQATGLAVDYRIRYEDGRQEPEHAGVLYKKPGARSEVWLETLAGRRVERWEDLQPVCFQVEFTGPSGDRFRTRYWFRHAEVPELTLQVYRRGVLGRSHVWRDIAKVQSLSPSVT